MTAKSSNLSKFLKRIAHWKIFKEETQFLPVTSLCGRHSTKKCFARILTEAGHRLAAASSRQQSTADANFKLDGASRHGHLSGLPYQRSVTEAISCQFPRLFTGILSAATLLVLTSAHAANLVTNSSFELGTNGWTFTGDAGWDNQDAAHTGTGEANWMR